MSNDWVWDALERLEAARRLQMGAKWAPLGAGGRAGRPSWLLMLQ